MMRLSIFLRVIIVATKKSRWEMIIVIRDVWNYQKHFGILAFVEKIVKFVVMPHTKIKIRPAVIGAKIVLVVKNIQVKKKTDFVANVLIVRNR